MSAPAFDYMFPQPLTSFLSGLDDPELNTSSPAEQSEFESIGICRTFVAEAVLAHGGADRTRVVSKKRRMKKSYLAMDDGEKAAAEAENAIMLAKVNFMVAY